ncbi:beta-N-acetylhexosaminidase [Pseudonocardia nigra]|uniref:beta-N-acetylhexosaminidase n=1 Tax=Pseudonocardia nigra TaxID=1921578 RepID=UPI001C5E5880|nr:beta-N-acetylhexosaminidase [Pseudonocardia nigra]
MSSDHPAHGLVPRPRAVQPRAGHVDLPDGAVVVAHPDLRAAARWWRRTCEDAFGVAWDERGPDTSGAVAFALDADLPAGGYALDVGDGRVDVRAPDAAGAHAAAQTLRQLLGPAAFRRAGTGPVRVPCVTISDAPRCGWRGVLLDVARHFLPKDGVLRMVDLAAAHKLNVLQLHLTDDQGWRVEIRSRPRLTEVGAWRTGSQRGALRDTPADATPHGGYYTQDDLREIVAYAAARGVTVVPEIDLPGHSQAAIAAYPELGMPGTAGAVGTAWGITDGVVRPTGATVEFFTDVLDEVLEVFDAPVIHLGGDEVPTTAWRDDGELVAHAAELGLSSVDGLHSWFVARLAAHLSARGRRAAVWDEALGPDLPAAAVVMSWRGVAQGAQAIAGGWDVVMAPEQFVYLDHRAADGPDEPVPVGFVRTVDDVYGFDVSPPPVRTALDASAPGRLLGAQAALWTEHLDSGRRVDYAAFPRLAAFAEAVWSDEAQRDLADFRRRLTTHHLPRLDAAGVEYRPETGPQPWQRRPGVPGRPRDLAEEWAEGGWAGMGGWREP